MFDMAATAFIMRCLKPWTEQPLLSRELRNGDLIGPAPAHP
jgi:hypothetical protein